MLVAPRQAEAVSGQVKVPQVLQPPVLKTSKAGPNTLLKERVRCVLRHLKNRFLKLPVLKTSQAEPNSLSALLKERVRSNLKRLKNQLLKLPVLETSQAGPNSLLCLKNK